MTDYPDVPPDPGVPPVARDPNNPVESPALLTGDTVTVNGYSNLPKWGLLDSNGKSVIPADNIVSFEYRQDWAIADYQVEDGGFQSYDKVQLPFDARMSFSCGGSEESRSDFLTAIQNLVNDYNLYSIVTPEYQYKNVNAAHMDYRRTSTNGVGLLLVNLYFLEIRNTATSSFSNTNSSPASPSATQDPGAAAQVNDGTVQPGTVTAAQSAALLNADLISQTPTLQ